MKSVLGSILFVAILILSPFLAKASSHYREDRSMDTIMEKTTNFRDMNYAVKKGYKRSSDCVKVPGAKNRGVYYYNPNYNPHTWKDGQIDASWPTSMVYMPDDYGNYSLSGLEYMTPAYARTRDGEMLWDQSSAPSYGWADRAPSLYGKTFDGPVANINRDGIWGYYIQIWITVSGNNMDGTYGKYDGNNYWTGCSGQNNYRPNIMPSYNAPNYNQVRFDDSTPNWSNMTNYPANTVYPTGTVYPNYQNAPPVQTFDDSTPRCSNMGCNYPGYYSPGNNYPGYNYPINNYQPCNNCQGQNYPVDP